jgi:hypothetical protein
LPAVRVGQFHLLDSRVGTHPGEGTLAAALVRLEWAWRAAGAMIADYLAPGLAEDEVVATLRAAGLEATEDVITLYSWRDGVWCLARPEARQAIDVFEFNSLREALEIRRMMIEIAQQTNPERQEELWPSSMLPIAGADGSHVMVDMHAGKDAGSSPVYDQGRDGDRSIVTSSLRELVDISAAQIEAGVWTWELVQLQGHYDIDPESPTFLTHRNEATTVGMWALHKEKLTDALRYPGCPRNTPTGPPKGSNAVSQPMYAKRVTRG